MKYLLSLVAVIVLSGLITAQEKDPKKDDNPYRTAKVGDWVEFKMTTTVGTMNIEGKVKMTVTEKSDKEATVKTTATVNGAELPGQETKIDLTKPYDPATSSGTASKGAEVKTEKIDDGKEKIKIGDKEYDCTWTRTKVSGKVNGLEMEGEVKVWVAKDVPLGGFVKMENATKVMGNAVNAVMEFLSSGNSK